MRGGLQGALLSGARVLLLALMLFLPPSGMAEGQMRGEVDINFNGWLDNLTCENRPRWEQGDLVIAIQGSLFGPSSELRSWRGVLTLQIVGNTTTAATQPVNFSGYINPQTRDRFPAWVEGGPYTVEARTGLRYSPSLWDRDEPIVFVARLSAGPGFSSYVSVQDTGTVMLNCDDRDVAPPEEVELPDYRIAVETNRVTDEPFEGLVADGTNRLRFLVDLPGVSSVRAVPGHGRFEDEAGAPLGEEIPLDGRRIVFYRPPAYVDTLWMDGNHRFVDLPDPLNPQTLWGLASAAVEPVRFEFTDARGERQVRDGELLVARPPVVFVHGFLGDRRTWTDFGEFLSGREFSFRADDYYETDESGSQNVRGQAQLLRRVLADERHRYARLGIKGGKADLVTHSMGGLVARYYVSQYDNYDADVRKILMIGTPNHGIDRVVRNLQGRAGTWWYGLDGRGHSGMKTDVHYESPLLSDLNRGEDAGAHLNRDVQYGNIYARFDDQVTLGASADLQGVAEVILPQGRYTHSSYIGTPTILEAGETRRAVLDWLLRDIPLGPFTEWVIEVSPEEPGSAALNGTPVTGDHTRVVQNDRVRTGPSGRATVVWHLNGHRFAEAILEERSEVRIAYYSPWSVRLVMTQGSATFRSFKGAGVEGEVSVLLAQEGYGSTTYDQQITADLNTFGTTFAVRMEGDSWDVAVLDGEVEVDDARPGAAEPMRLRASQGATLTPATPAAVRSVSPGGWWEDALAWAEASVDEGPAVESLEPEGHGQPGAPTPGGVTMEDVYAVEAYGSDLQAVGAAISSRAQAGFTPVGLAMGRGQIHVLYLGSGVMPITEWQLDWHDDTADLQAGINQRMSDGYLPNGFAWQDGRFYVLYVRTDFTGSAWQIVTSDVDLQAVNRDLQPWLAQDYIPFDVTLAQGRYMTLLVQLPEKLAEQWSLEGVYPDGVGDLIEQKLLSGFFPWGLLVDDVANVLFLGF